MVTRSVEDYLKAIYKLQQDGSPATTNSIAESLGLRAASVTAMLQQLSKQGLAEYKRYKGAYLTEGGLATALRVIRRHRLIELYLNQHLSVPWDCVHDEAERLEHAITPYLEERIDAKLGYPSFDPHGAPIPSSTGSLPVQDLVPLLDLPPNTSSVVRHIPDDDPELLRYVASLGLKPDVQIVVREHDSVTGDIVISIGSMNNEHIYHVGRSVAQHIFVRRPA
jgi:DtxR family Mn-dependent transcriptional regulator